MMEKELSFSLQGFKDEEVAKELSNLTSQVIRVLGENYQLDISKLRKITISHDFVSALEQAATDYNHKSSPTFTNTEQATSIAKLMSKVESNGELSEYNLVLCVNFFYEILNDDGTLSLDNMREVAHRIHHELVHIHELNTNCLDRSKLVDDYDNVFLMTGMRSWSEFLANYMSSQTATEKSIATVAQTLESILNEVPIEIASLIYQYQNNRITLSDMHISVTNKIKLIVNMYGYFFGYIRGLNLDLESRFPVLQETITSSRLASALEELGNAFEVLKDNFDNGGIHDYSDFNVTFNAISSIYLSFGLKVEREMAPKMGLYIHVY